MARCLADVVREIERVGAAASVYASPAKCDYEEVGLRQKPEFNLWLVARSLAYPQ
jgi:hypothetical protein